MRQRQYGERGIGPSAGSEDRAASDMQVAVAMNRAIFVDHARISCAAHAGGSHVVVTTDGVITDRRIDRPGGCAVFQPGRSL